MIINKFSIGKKWTIILNAFPQLKIIDYNIKENMIALYIHYSQIYKYSNSVLSGYFNENAKSHITSTVNALFMCIIWITKK